MKDGRLIQSPSGGPGNKPRYAFWAPSGDNVWTPGPAGRSELSYPIGDPGNAPPHTGPSGAYFFYEGTRHVIMASTLLGPGWDVNAPDWRVALQIKQNEWVDTGGTTPQLSLQQRSGEWIITSRSRSGSDDIVWRMPADNEVAFALDVTFSADPTKGKLTVHADRDMHGIYEYTSSTWTGQTLFYKNGTGVEGVLLAGLYQGVGGGSLSHSDLSIWG